MQTLVNCSDETVEVMFGGQIFVFEPGDEMTLMDDVARHLKMRSIIHDNPVTGKGVFALHYKSDMPTEIQRRKGPELLDRSDMLDPHDRNVQYIGLVNPVDYDPGKTKSALDQFQGPRSVPEPGSKAKSRPA